MTYKWKSDRSERVRGEKGDEDGWMEEDDENGKRRRKKTKKPGGKSKWSDARASRIRREEMKSGDKGIRERERETGRKRMTEKKRGEVAGLSGEGTSNNL